MENEKTIIVGRMPDIGITKLFSVVEKIEDFGIRPAAIIFPFHYDLLNMNWENGNYKISDLLKLIRNKIGLEEVPLLILGEKGLYTVHPYYCEEVLKTCLLTNDEKLGEVLEFLLEYIRRQK
ncbi:MAG: hypothetical protein ACP5LZ_00200 [Fervidicoccaceae archaeon]